MHIELNQKNAGKTDKFNSHCICVITKCFYKVSRVFLSWVFNNSSYSSLFNQKCNVSIKSVMFTFDWHICLSRCSYRKVAFCINYGGEKTLKCAACLRWKHFLQNSLWTKVVGQLQEVRHWEFAAATASIHLGRFSIRFWKHVRVFFITKLIQEFLFFFFRPFFVRWEQKRKFAKDFPHSWKHTIVQNGFFFFLKYTTQSQKEVVVKFLIG